MQRNEAIKFITLKSLGNFLVLFSLYGVYATFGPAISAEIKYKIVEARGIQFHVSDVAQSATVATNSAQQVSSQTIPQDSLGRDISFTDVLAGSRNQDLMPKDLLFSILIPKVGANAKIFPNVDPESPEVFLPILKQGVAHAKGSVFPGFPGNTYLFAHSTDNWWDAGQYNAIFYTLNNLSEGDDIIIFFENRRYDYKVTNKIIADPDDVSLLTAPHTGPNKLVLQTCWPPGTTWKRLYVIAIPTAIKPL